VPLDAVPDITNNQVQVITQSPNLGTEDIEQFITYPVELAMSNLPGVTEIRSVSRFGLSLVTIVFEDHMGTYLPRQLVSEKLIAIKEDIPPGFGAPTMGPISTGLGEIYQYTLEVDQAFEGKYSAADLRSMQDWIVRRQMAMVPGVIEVNAFGGDIKQYEVAIDLDRLRAMDLSITQVFTALETNNENSGGAYIEKNHQANFIRGEGLIKSLGDIESIVVHHVNDIPIKIKDIATVRFGKAIKYGAFTKDGKGEAVGGMILMLKGANSNEVIKAVKARVAEIQKSMPEGVVIEPFLDRSKLIANTTSTVGENLMLGALIVIFVLIFLLGNWRAGIVVASTIPLSLLFAFILMNVFGVWANLMSLGAIDFGIIIDGAVIIVEGTVFLLHERVLKGLPMGAPEKEAITQKASGKVMNAAFFGQLIVLIVFVPVLALQGVEGKMFQPMALTFIFAMIGVMLLCLTYVPMMSSWIIEVKATKKETPGDRLVKRLENWYGPLLEKALTVGKWLVGSAVLLMVLALATFSKMGAEFMPKLDEEDIAFHSILKPGSSLSETIAATTRIEQLLMAQFPEIKHVMSRIGVADVPTDPMPMDIADCFIILHPQEEWTSGLSKAALVEKMKEAVQIVPGINYEFTQPIEMRFNELITGVREDVAIKLFGEDLDVLASKAQEIGTLISPIEGVADMKVEATKGLPQMTVVYNRNKIAQYGLRIVDLNRQIQTAFAGGIAGVIFEGERRFDLVVRLDEEHRKSIDHLKGLFVSLENGAQIPLKEVAEIAYQPGPMQISRDNTNRRTYVGINVRGRDIKSLVEEIKEKLDAELKLPAGYYIRYGGAFENLERASKRLQVLVPIALGLIFILIFFALRSLSQTTMIYIAIPLAAIGGVFSLWIRGMPFSLSAGVGFIVLFGVAVLNGLVLISAWNELRDEGVSNLKERIALGAKRRIRPILLTALTDVLGFLPMALSTSAGAEVQRPLATVVIGGMITATLLTLFVLPILYYWIEKRNNNRHMKQPVIVSILITLALLSFSVEPATAQDNNRVHVGSSSEAVAMALANNPLITIAEKNTSIERKGIKSAYNIEKTTIGVQLGQYNSFSNDLSFTASQRIEFPRVYLAQRDVAQARIEASELQNSITGNELSYQIRTIWEELVLLTEKRALLLERDSLHQKFLKAATLRYETGEGSYLEKISAETQASQVENELNLIASDLLIQKRRLQVLIHADTELELQPEKLTQRKLPQDLYDSTVLANNPGLQWALKQAELSKAQGRVSEAKKLPDISFGYFNQSMIGNPIADGSIAGSGDRFTGVQVGISVPLFFGSYKARATADKLNHQIAESEALYFHSQLAGKYQSQLHEITKYQSALNYYKNQALQQAQLLLENAEKSFSNGAISYIEYFKSVDQALAIEHAYLHTQSEYNKAVIRLEYLLGV